MQPANKGALWAATILVVAFLAALIYLRPNQGGSPAPEPAPTFRFLSSDVAGFQSLPVGLQLALAAAVVKGELPQDTLQLIGGVARYQLDSGETEAILREIASSAVSKIEGADLAVVTIQIDKATFRRLLLYRPASLDDRVEAVLEKLAPKRLGASGGYESRILIGA